MLGEQLSEKDMRVIALRRQMTSDQTLRAGLARTVYKAWLETKAKIDAGTASDFEKRAFEDVPTRGGVPTRVANLEGLEKELFDLLG